MQCQGCYYHSFKQCHKYYKQTKSEENKCSDSTKKMGFSQRQSTHFIEHET
jgi:hypothetical protein